MQIVIDIPLEWLFDMKNKKFCQTDSLYQKILNGTPLPEKHGRLVDVDEFEKLADKRFEYIISSLLNHIQTYDVYSLLEATPTIIEADTESEEEDSDNLDPMLEDLWNDYDKGVEE